MSKLAMMRKLSDRGYELIGLIDGESPHTARMARIDRLFRKVDRMRGRCERYLTRRNSSGVAKYQWWDGRYFLASRVFVRRLHQWRKLTMDLSRELSRGVR